MILLDVNLLLYAENSGADRHKEARQWLDTTLNGTEEVGFCWQTVSAFIRIGTNRHVYAQPLTTEEAVGKVDRWLALPIARIVRPTEAHWRVFRELLISAQITANLLMDARLAALAMERDAFS